MVHAIFEGALLPPIHVEMLPLLAPMYAARSTRLKPEFSNKKTNLLFNKAEFKSDASSHIEIASNFNLSSTYIDPLFAKKYKG